MVNHLWSYCFFNQFGGALRKNNSRRAHIFKIVLTGPLFSHRRTDVFIRALLINGFPTRFSFFEKTISSMIAIDGKNPISKKTSLRTKIPWSPVAILVTLERRFIMDSMILKILFGWFKCISNQPQEWSCSAASIIFSNLKLICCVTYDLQGFICTASVNYNDFRFTRFFGMKLVK